MKLSGQTGRLLVGGRLAANLKQWHGEHGDGSLTLTATLIRPDAFWLVSAGPFCLELDVSQSVWCWSAVDVSIDGVRVEITATGKPGVKGNG